ncbi:aldo-keto reductase [Xylaria sp. CBS 124048]|nr:aldo-keto reductase [Xylaria sp. CBS 124048]
MPANYPQRKIGDDSVSAIGLGCMGMSFAYSTSGFDDNESFNVLTAAADAGITFWDTSDMYGPFTNEALIGRWFKETGRRDEIFLATKFGIKFVDGGLAVDGTPEWVKEACKASLERLQTDRIDLYYQHRADPHVPIEKSVQAMAELKAEGKIRYLGLSECSAKSLRRAYAVHPIAALQVEYSPFALEIESERTKLLATARELGIKLIPYSPLGRGFLTGSLTTWEQLDPSDARHQMPRFSKENFPGNLELVKLMREMAQEKGVTVSQLALAWSLAQGDDFIPIPGTKKVKNLLDNIKAAYVVVTKEDDARIRKAIDSVGGTKGDPYAAALMPFLYGDTPEL